MWARALIAVKSRNPALPLLDVLELVAGVADEFLDQLGIEVGLDLEGNFADLLLEGLAHGWRAAGTGSAGKALAGRIAASS
jgi:hypothetical protein